MQSGRKGKRERNQSQRYHYRKKGAFGENVVKGISLGSSVRKGTIMSIKDSGKKKGGPVHLMRNVEQGRKADRAYFKGRVTQGWFKKSLPERDSEPIFNIDRVRCN